MYEEIIQSMVSNCTPAEAKSIYHQMQCNAFDFSEADHAQFQVGILSAKIDLDMEEMSEESLEALYMSM